MKSIYAIIQDNLKKALVLSLGATATVLVIFSYFSLKAVENHASTFIMKHTARLAEAGINAQNVGDVEKEVSRFVDSWKETQDLEARVDLFIDEKLVAHAGQLLPFNFLSTSVTKNTLLSSGQILTASVQINLFDLIMIRGAELLIFEIFILIVYFLLVSRMRKSIQALTKPLEGRVEWLKLVASKLPESAKMTPPFEVAKVTEIDDLSKSIEILLSEIVNLESNIAVINFDKGRVKMAEQVAHNIKGAIATLQLKIESLSALSQNDRNDLANCLNSIRDGSVNLLKAKKKEQPSDVTAEKISTDLKPFVARIFEMKRQQYKKMTDIHFDDSQTENLNGISIQILPLEFEAVLNNLIDNAVESFPDASGIVSLKVLATPSSLEISICDNGKGISKEILTKLLSVGGSYGKENGTGIGLSHAKETIAQLGGELLIRSSENSGTAITIKVPRNNSSLEFIKKINISDGAMLLVIDDDPSIHTIWKNKINKIGLKNSIEFFATPADFNAWIDTHGQGAFGSRHYFFDFDLKDDHFNGLDLMEQHGIGLESLLISGLADESEVYKRARGLGAQCLKKYFLEATPILVLRSETKMQTAQVVSEQYH